MFVKQVAESTVHPYYMQQLCMAVFAVVRNPDSKVHGAKMGPIWDRQHPGGPHVGPMNLAIWEAAILPPSFSIIPLVLCNHKDVPVSMKQPWETSLNISHQPSGDSYNITKSKWITTKPCAYMMWHTILMVKSNTAVTPLLTHCSYCSLDEAIGLYISWPCFTLNQLSTTMIAGWCGLNK